MARCGMTNWKLDRESSSRKFLLARRCSKGTAGCRASRRKSVTDDFGCPAHFFAWLVSRRPLALAGVAVLALWHAARASHSRCAEAAAKPSLNVVMLCKNLLTRRTRGLTRRDAEKTLRLQPSAKTCAAAVLYRLVRQKIFPVTLREVNLHHRAEKVETKSPARGLEDHATNYEP
jgi:hypothetical protein